MSFEKQKIQYYPIAPITDFVLTEHTNNLYKQVANSSIDLAKKCAEKINEVINSFNELAKEKWEKIHEQDGSIRSAILYMKDNLLNTVDSLLKTKGDEMMDNAVKEYLGTLKAELDHVEKRLNNLLGNVTSGSTSLDAEVIDIRVDINGVNHDSAGVSIRANQKKNISYISEGNLNNFHGINQYSIVLGKVLNTPENKTGFVDIQSYRSSDNVYWTVQKWNTQDGTSYIRVYRNGWSEWLSLSKPNSVNITKSLDEYVEDSLFAYVPGNTAGSPVVYGGLLDVQVYKVPNTTTKMITQIYYAYGINRIYFRTNIGGNWKDWLPMNPLFDKKDYTYIDNTKDLNDFTDNFYGVALGTAKNTPENDTALIEVQRHGSTVSTTYWTRQTWWSLNTGNVYNRILIPNGSWSKWTKEGGTGGNSVLSGKKVVFMGDSILGNKRDATGIVKQFETLTGATCFNFAFGGTRAKTRNDNNFNTWGQFDGETLISSICNHNFEGQNYAVNTADDFLYYFGSTLEEIKSFDFSTVDYLVINWGTNDWSGNVNHEEYCEAINNIIQMISSYYPNIITIIMTPTIRFFYNEDSDEIISSSDYNFERSDGMVLQDFINDSIITNRYNTQIIDTYNIGINTFNVNGFFTAPDYTHHNANGCKRIATYLAKHIC